MDPKAKKGKSVKEVELDAYVALKIIKFSRESKLGLSGALLGFEAEDKLIVSNCYPLPKLSIHQNEYHENYEIAAEMDRQRKVGSDILSNMQLISEDFVIVGWYQSSLMGDYINEVSLQSQYEAQANYPQRVCIIYEVSLADQSLKCFKAIQLAPFAMELIAKGAVLGKDLSKASEELFVEIPIVLKRSHLLQQYILQEEKRHDLYMNSGILQLFPEQYAINHMMYLNGYLNKFVKEQTRAYDKKWGKREDDSAGTYLLGNQILSFCKELHGFIDLIDIKQKLMKKLTGVDRVPINS
eukprot:TRINITY_DN7989_c0_g3_i3.p1 TRINITY_DN7989_c0_g3~~TRINITY_DN7989_c0_g3_i3.p1  ORF type:complete len:297 (+),score=99.08 TRINITY_DN7989_c0_g3_i3:70-960(+)